ncbi:hypothetical protein LP420_04605 [Massilia sp. B-10]|nr:hypothetical protein LP420_04605 [Massilia sp. B-10]
MLPARRAGRQRGARGIEALKAQLDTKAGQEPATAIPLVRAALKDKATLAPADTLWLLSHLSEALRRNKQLDEALLVAREGQAAAGKNPREQVRFGRLVTLLLHDAVKDPAAIREFEKIAPLLPDLAKPESTKASKLVAADAWRMGGIVLTSLGQLPEAMDLLMRALRIYDANDDQEFEQVDCLNAIALVHFKTGLGWKKHCAEVDRSIQIAAKAKMSDALSRGYLRKSHFLSTMPTGSTSSTRPCCRRARSRSRRKTTTTWR